MGRVRDVGLILGILLALAAAAEAAGDQLCPTDRAPPLSLPRLRDALANGRPVTILTFGSSSTEGSHSSDLAHSYPAVLQTLLNAALPKSHIAVINRGVGGQDVQEMLLRMDADALAIRPTVVIWQLGSNSAIRHMPPDQFEPLLSRGVTRLLHGGTDIVLMDSQRAPAVLAAPENKRIGQMLARVATAKGVALFSRGALMDAWQEHGFPNAMFLADDGLHHNDFGYRCVAQALSNAILDGLPAASPAIAGRR